MLETEYNEAEVMELFKEDGRREGIEQGLKQGLEAGIQEGLIKGAVDMLRDMDISEDMILKKIMDKYKLSKEKVLKYL